VTEISAVGQELRGCHGGRIARADETLRGTRAAWVKEQQVRVAEGKVAEYQVNMLVTFELEE
jgi:flavin-binding protein dodecin